MKYPPFLISPFWLAVLFGLVYLWLHCVASLSKRLTPQGKSEPYLNLLIILTGPLAWIGWWGGKRRMHTKDGWKGLVSSVKAFVRRRWGSRRYDENVITILAGADGTVATSLSRRSGHHNEAMALTLARQMIDWAVDLRASDIFMDPKQEQAYELRYRVDGLLREPQRIERETALATLNCFKILAEMNIAERRRAQDGSLLAYYNDREIKLRVATAGTVYGEKIVIRVLDAAVGLFRLDQLGLSHPEMSLLRRQIHRPHGMLLICGPTGSGKSTTLYAAINELGSTGRNIITIEDPIEYALPIASQTAVNPKADITFASQLRHVLRQSPDVIMVGEIRDAETARIALQASETGHLVFSTLHSNDAVTGLIRLVELGIEPHTISASVNCLMSQRLVRRLCTQCRERASVSGRLRREAEARRIPLGNVHEPVGCPACEGTGYKGREGIFEILEMSPAIGEQLASRPTMNALFEVARAGGMISIRQDGIAKVLNGTTSVAEVVRVTVFR
ncbi:MAG: type II/IV secretion system protein [Planctomycetes bacterium]|nr:type II/IV secretion system protein [Planctomycetota bacterium]